MLKRTIAILTLTSLAILAIILTTTTPSTAGPLGILGFFVFMYAAVLGVLTFLLYGMGQSFEKLPAFRRQKLRGARLTFRRSYYYSSVLALAPVMLIAMQSVNQVGIYQLLLIGFFMIVAWTYIINRVT